MPYSGPGDRDLPQHVRRLPKKKRERWVEVFNSVFKRTGDDGEAMHQANGSVKTAARIISADDHDEASVFEGAAEHLRGVLKSAGADEAFIESKIKALADKCGVDYAMEPYRPYGGAITFDELDAHTEATERNGRLTALTWQFEQLVQNIMSDDEVPLDVKGRRIQEVAGALEERVARTRVEPIEYKNPGQKSIVDRARTLLFGDHFAAPVGERATWTSAYVNKLPDSAFAVVKPGGKKDADGRTTPRTLRMLPHHDANGDVDAPHLRAAWARVNQDGTNVSDEERSKAKSHIKRHAAAAGVELSAKDAEVATGPGMFWLTKQADGRTRYVAVATNRYEDVDGELFSEKAHRWYVDQANKSALFPELRLWHHPAAKIGQSDAVTYDEASGFRVSTGLIDEGMEHVAEKLAKIPDLGMSHGYVYGYADLGDDGVYDRYFSFEESVLPMRFAANHGTAFTVRQEDNMALDDKQRAFFVDVLGEDAVTAIESSNATAAKDLIDAGVRFKAALDAAGKKDGEGTGDPPADAGAQSTTAAAPAESAQSAAADGEGAAGTAAGDPPAGDQQAEKAAGLIRAALKPELDAINELVEWKKGVDDALVALKTSRDDELAALILPRTGPMRGASDDGRTQPRGKALEEARAIVEAANKGGDDLPPETAAVAPLLDMMRVQTIRPGVPTPDQAQA